MHVYLRDVIESDLEILFQQQLDPDANYMAAFTSENPGDREAFMARWARILSDDTITKRTIIADDEVAGSIVHFVMFDQPQIGYWLGKSFWGQGIATQAVSAFIGLVPVRPLYARVVKDNVGSRRVLEKCGFRISGEDKGFAHARQAEVEEYILVIEK